MAITVLLDFNVQPGKADEMVQWMKDNLPDTRARQGAGKMELIIDQDDPNHMVVYEVWDSKADQEAYIAWRAERGDLEILGAFFCGAAEVHLLRHRRSGLAVMPQ